MIRIRINLILLYIVLSGNQNLDMLCHFMRLTAFHQMLHKQQNEDMACYCIGHYITIVAAICGSHFAINQEPAKPPSTLGQ